MNESPFCGLIYLIFTLSLGCAHLQSEQSIRPPVKTDDTLRTPQPLNWSTLDGEDGLALTRSLWSRCLQGLLSADITRQRSSSQEHNNSVLASQCANLMTRASENLRPRLLQREWVILDAHESISPALALTGLSRSPRGFHQGSWRLSISLLRLPPDRSMLGMQTRHPLSERGTPEPLLHWSQSKIERASVSEWSTLGVEHHMLTKARQQTLSTLPTPRVGQVIHLELSRPAPQITRGGWALHLPLRFSAPSLRYILTLKTPRGASIKTFGASADETRHLSHETQYRWSLSSRLPNVGKEVYLTTTSTWASLHRWLWRSFEEEREGYKRFVSQHIEETALSYFLSPRSISSTHLWVKRFLHYSPRPYRPYNPLPIRQLLSKREGDCKEFALFSQTLLSLQGQPAFIALASTKPLPTNALRTPSLGWFDHALLWLPSDSAMKLARLASRLSPPVLDPGLSRYQWFDATSNAPQTPLTQSIKGQHAYVLLSDSQGVWVPISPR